MISYPREIGVALERLYEAGHEAYIVGGALRDALLGRKAGDFDITTSAMPEETQAVFADFKTIETGLKHGTLTVLIDGMPIEITTYRVDGDYTDSRHPSSVRFTRTLSEDLLRRDFTVNAMAYSRRGGFVDLYGGREDLGARLIRAVGEPKKRFSEDALRILRAFRFCSKLGFDIEKNTLSAISACREGLGRISAERIAVELRGILEGENAYHALTLMKASGVWELVLRGAKISEAVCRLPRVFEVRLAFLMRETELTALSAYLHDLKLSNQSISKVIRLCTMIKETPVAAEPAVRRLLARVGDDFEHLMAMYAVLGKESEAKQITHMAAECIARGDCLRIADLAIDGKDVAALGKKGKEIGQTLDALLEMVLDEPRLNTRQTLLAMIKESL
jgi:tRNA nucleotidyltransferase (CCA-adding enzyme)